MRLDAVWWEDCGGTGGDEGRMIVTHLGPVVDLEEQPILLTQVGMDVWNGMRHREDGAPEGGRGHDGRGMTTTRWPAD